MENPKSLVGKKINLDLLTKELDKNNHKLRVCDFLNLFYVVMSELEEQHPIVKHAMEKLGDDDYNNFICSVVFGLCMRLSVITLSEEAFTKMIDRLTMEEVELESEPTNNKVC